MIVGKDEDERGREKNKKSNCSTAMANGAFRGKRERETCLGLQVTTYLIELTTFIFSLLGSIDM